ncbi:P-II family nitrogen regulator [Pontimonas sp.]|jgi:nitrogen regulatory protein PII|uniref:P-II family nitrogen regulator n=1 Tax=Pontimonas sp. TaxID=2304492 RepID=UPI002870AA79|nr:transcriptional regulator [Pontimonas sp.]MDR9396193.1 transcriptional regulator [Pontimonas sp.]MDR9434516.1 transcriptional regulator [Pontimonas sp.]
MELTSRTVVTIVAESALESRLVADLSAAGVPGYTVTPAHGAGVRGQREGDIQGGNIRIETVLPHDTALGILAMLQDKYFSHYACVAWLSQASVVRGEHF